MTNRFWTAGGMLVIGGCLWAALASHAADKVKPTADKEKPAATTDGDQSTEAKSSEQADAVEDIATAYQLADWGRRMDPQSPFALCTAAEMLHRTTLFSGTDAKFKDRVQAPESTEKQDPQALNGDVEKLLTEAIKMAKTNKQDVAAVQAMAKAVREGRGGLNGPLTFTMALRPGQTDSYNIKFRRNEWVRIAVHHPEATRVHLEVINPRGVVRAVDGGFNPKIGFVPHAEDGLDFTVRVTNNSPIRITYNMFTN